MTFTDKRQRADLFRDRLRAAMAETKLSQSELARRIRVDRSTISQLLSGEDARLPNAQVIAESATALGVSADWLLGLSERPERAADILAATVAMSPAQRSLVDEQIFSWHREAEGYKIRHVPARLPDMLKTQAFLEWEYSPHLGRSTAEAITASQERLDWMRSSHSDFEIAIPLFELSSMVGRTGYYETLPRLVRDAQIDRLMELHDQLYPTLRIFLFDARQLHAAAITVFGPRIAVLYVGQMHLAFRDSERVRALTRHFDELIREAYVGAREFPDHLGSLDRGE